MPGLAPENREYGVLRRGDELRRRKPNSRRWRIEAWLDQGQEGACVGFSRAHDMASAPQVWTSVTEQMARELYNLARQRDEWPGEMYEGSSVLGGAKAACELGYLKEYWWAFSLEEFILALGHKAPAVVGVNWHTDMQDTNDNGYIKPTGDVDGGHAILISAQSLVWKRAVSAEDWTIADLDLDESWVEFHNSWGKKWGTQGRARMTMRDWDKLRQEDGEVCFSVGIREEKKDG